MTDFGAEFQDVCDALVALAGTVNVGNLTVKKSYFGPKEGGREFPCCFTIPMPDVIVDTTIVVPEHTMAFDLVFIHENQNVEQGLKDVIKLAGKAYDLLLANRQLNGKTDDLTVTRMTPGYTTMRTYVRHHMTLRVECKKMVF